MLASSGKNYRLVVAVVHTDAFSALELAIGDKINYLGKDRLTGIHSIYILSIDIRKMHYLRKSSHIHQWHFTPFKKGHIL